MERTTWRQTWLLSAWLVMLATAPAAGADDIRFRPLPANSSLSQVGIICVVQDPRGYLWVGTEDGLNRFDGNRFTIYRHDPDDPGSLGGSFIRQIYLDAANTMWVVSGQGDLNRYERESDRFTRLGPNPSPGGAEGPRIRAVVEDRDHRFWAAAQGTELYLLDRDTLTFTPVQPRTPTGAAWPISNVQEMRLDRHGMLWIGGNGGVARLDPTSQQATLYQPEPGNPQSLSHPLVFALGFDAEGNLWAGTSNGLNRLNPDGRGFTVYRNDPQDPTSLSFNVIRCLFSDDQQRFWVGTEKGLNRYHPDRDAFTVYRHEVADPDGLSQDNVWDMAQDRAGNLWIGTMGGGLSRHTPILNKFQHIRHILGNPNSLSHPNIWSMVEDKHGRIWIACDNGGLNIYEPADNSIRRLPTDASNPHGLNAFRKLSLLIKDNRLWIASAGGGIQVMDLATEKVVKSYRHDPADPKSLTADIVISVNSDSRGTIWIATLEGGISRYMPSSDDFVNYHSQADNPQTIGAKGITTIIEKERDQLWIGTIGAGLNLLDVATGKVRRIDTDPNNPNTLRGATVYGLYQEADGVLWVGTIGGGLNRYDPATDRWRSWRTKHGLPNDTVYGILPGEGGSLWLSTNNGLAHFDKKTHRFRNYYANDGLQGSEFNLGAYLRDSKGFLYFAGINGITRFRPEAMSDSTFEPRTVFTQLLIANRPVKLQQETFGQPQGAALQSAEAVTLDHTRNMFTLEFSALDYTIPGNIRYRYKLDGYNSTWLETDELNRRATYTNLPAGSYDLRVKATNADGVWSKREAVLRLNIKPPPWLSWWAKSLYALLALSLIGAYLRIQAQKLAREQQIARQQSQLAGQAEAMAENERNVANRLRQIDKLKDEFLANTSHELRTPLNGMIGLAESLKGGYYGELPEPAKLDLDLIVSSGKRLSHLINDILNFSLIKKGQLIIHPAPVDLHALVTVVLALSRPLIGKKPVALANLVPKDMPRVFADENRLEQILHNLVGNAVKFTHRGHIQVRAEVRDATVVIAVADTGIGIAAENQQAVFDMFQQADGSTAREYGGTGLGLAVTRELLKLQQGSITLESTLGQGSTFYVTLPLAAADAEGDGTPVVADEAETLAEPAASALEAVGTLPSEPHNGYRILIVDDDAVNRRVLANHLTMSGYDLEEAQDGYEALRLVQQAAPFDLVLLDVMMPRMTGYEVCRELRTCHSLDDLPIIFLTAKSRDQDLLTGYETGANDFLIKPISKTELLARVKTHLALLDAHRDLEAKVAARTRGLVAAQEELLEAAHQAGMSEMATDVLHNVGNRLNSLTTAVHLIEELVDKNRGLELLRKIGGLLRENHDTLPEFFAGDPRAQSVTTAVEKITHSLTQRDKSLKEDGAQLAKYVKETLKLLSEQNKYAEVRGHSTPSDPNKLISEALQIGLVSFEEQNIQVTTNQEPGLPLVMLNRARLMRVLLCLLRNAEEAVTTEAQKGPGRITVGSARVGSQVVISIEDNGVGIEAGNLVRIFAYGVSTKDGRTGFGLHYCANVVNEMSGKIDVKSEGLGKGTLVTMRFPIAGSEAEAASG